MSNLKMITTYMGKDIRELSDLELAEAYEYLWSELWEGNNLSKEKDRLTPMLDDMNRELGRRGLTSSNGRVVSAEAFRDRAGLPPVDGPVDSRESESLWDKKMGDAVRAVMDGKGNADNGGRHLLVVRDKHGSIFRLSIKRLDKYYSPSVRDGFIQWFRTHWEED